MHHPPRRVAGTLALPEPAAPGHDQDLEQTRQRDVRLADRMARIGTETAFEAAARARALEATGREVIHLEIGEPDFDTPRHISQAAARALLEDGATHYTAATGVEPLREAIVDDVARWKGISTT